MGLAPVRRPGLRGSWISRRKRRLLGKDPNAVPPTRFATRKVTVLRTVLLAACGLGLAGCDAIDSINPLRTEKYKTVIVPDVPANKLYSQGLAKLEDRDYEGATKKFEDLDKQSPIPTGRGRRC